MGGGGSYNAVNGVPSCANDWLLSSTLRDSWRFDGYVTGDCGAVQNECTDKPHGHNFTGTNCSLAAALSVQAGTDVDCGGVYGSGIPSAVKDGTLKEADVDTSFGRLTKMQMRLGLFDADKAQQPYFNFGLDVIDSPEHQQLALEAARQSITLLKNDGNILPLRSGGSGGASGGASGGKKIAVVGPHFNGTDVFLSNYHGSRCLNGKPGDGKDFSCITTPLQAIAAMNKGGKTVGAAGCDVDSARDDVAAAVSAAEGADAVVVVVGIDGSQEAEGRDRYNTTLPGLQGKLVAAIAALRIPDTVLVVVHGGAMSLGDLPAGAVPGAVVDAPYGGEMAATALAEVLFGQVNPSGKLAATWYPAGFVDQVPLTDMALAAGPHSPGRTHMFYAGKPEYQFGFGLSYTAWALEALEWTVTSPAAPTPAAPTLAAPPTPAAAAAAAAAAVAITTTHDGKAAVLDLREEASPRRHLFDMRVANRGQRDGRQTVLLFVRLRSSSAINDDNNDHSDHPWKAAGLRQRLVAYGGLDHVAAGASRALRLEASSERLLDAIAIADVEGDSYAHPGHYELVARDGVNEIVTPLVVKGIGAAESGARLVRRFAQ